MRLMSEMERAGFGGINEFGPPVNGEAQGPWIGDVTIEFPGGDTTDAVILAGQNDNGDAVVAVVWTEEDEPVEVVRLVAAVTCLKRAEELESKKRVKLLELGVMGYQQR